jgi:hypothetical protein
MLSVLSRLRLMTPRSCAGNIGWSCLATIFLMGVNFNTLVFPEWVIATLAVAILIFSLGSLVGYIYWRCKEWRHYDEGNRVMTIVYIAGLSLAEWFNVDILLRLALF